LGTTPSGSAPTTGTTQSLYLYSSPPSTTTNTLFATWQANAAFGANTTQIATAQYVMTRSVFWDGSRKFVSTSDPTDSDGEDGDIWFKYTP